VRCLFSRLWLDPVTDDLEGSSRKSSTGEFYGRHGRFLHNLSRVCLLSISSQVRPDAISNRIILSRGTVIGRQLGFMAEESFLNAHGTTVTVSNLFGDIPARSKHLSKTYGNPLTAAKEFEHMKLMLTGYLLAQCKAVETRFSLHGTDALVFRCSLPNTSDTSFSLQSIASILFQANLLASPETDIWQLVSLRTTRVFVRAAISKEPSASRVCQFISFMRVPIRKQGGLGCLFDAVDRLFEASKFGVVDDDENCLGESGRKQQFIKAVDRWPKYCIRIAWRTDEPAYILDQDAASADSPPMLEHLILTLQTLVDQFLTICGLTRGPRRCQSGREPDKLHDEHSNTPRSCFDSSSRSTTPIRQTGHLHQWKRVKSAHPLAEDFGYGLGFNEYETAIANTFEDEAINHESTKLSRDMIDHASEHADATLARLGQNDLVSVPWVNPRSGQELQINSRTGAVMRMRLGLGETTASPGMEQITVVTPSISHLRSKPVSSTNTDASNLRKYLRRKSFIKPEADVISTTLEEHDALALASSRVTRQGLDLATVIQQIDQKYVLVVLPTVGEADFYQGGQLLVLIDQHAADERIKYEALCKEFFAGESTHLSRPIVFEVDKSDAKLFELHRDHFQRWHISYQVRHPGSSQQIWRLEINALPAMIVERCRAEPRVLIDLMRHEIWSERIRGQTRPPEAPERDLKPWWRQIVDCPHRILDMVKSRSCRSAIMFNDVLDVTQCQNLIQEMGRCCFPFQCAHGRPSLTVLARLDDIGEMSTSGAALDDGKEDVGYGDAFRSWTRSG
jgi:DNA mismatch repair protein MLH3